MNIEEIDKKFTESSRDYCFWMNYKTLDDRICHKELQSAKQDSAYWYERLIEARKA